MWNSFFLLSLSLFFKPVVDLFSARVGQSCFTAICNFFFYCEGRCNGVPLFVMAVEFDHSGSYLGIAGSDIRCSLMALQISSSF